MGKVAWKGPAWLEGWRYMRAESLALPERFERDGGKTAGAGELWLARRPGRAASCWLARTEARPEGRMGGCGAGAERAPTFGQAADAA